MTDYSKLLSVPTMQHTLFFSGHWAFACALSSLQECPSPSQGFQTSVLVRSPGICPPGKFLTSSGPPPPGTLTSPLHFSFLPLKEKQDCAGAQHEGRDPTATCLAPLCFSWPVPASSLAWGLGEWQMAAGPRSDENCRGLGALWYLFSHL